MSALSLSVPRVLPEESTPPPACRILVPDACVGVKWFVPEPNSIEASRLLDPRFELHVPSYFFTEAASVLQRKVAVDRTLSEAEGLDAFQLLRTVPMTIHATEALLGGRVPARRPLPATGVRQPLPGAGRGGWGTGRDRRPSPL